MKEGALNPGSASSADPPEPGSLADVHRAGDDAGPKARPEARTANQANPEMAGSKYVPSSHRSRYYYFVWMEKVQRNALFEAIVTGGLDPIECHLDERSIFLQGNTALVIHQQSQSYFRLIKGSGGSSSGQVDRTTYLWRRVVENGPRTRGRVMGWSAVVELVGQWAKEVNAPDLWFGLRSTKMSLGGTQEGNSENTPFTIGEQLQISTKLREIKAYVKETYQLSDEEFARIEERLDEAEEASRRVGRKDWVSSVLWPYAHIDRYRSSYPRSCAAYLDNDTAWPQPSIRRRGKSYFRAT